MNPMILEALSNPDVFTLNGDIIEPSESVEEDSDEFVTIPGNDSFSVRKDINEIYLPSKRYKTKKLIV
jgi:hypothetical protein